MIRSEIYIAKSKHGYQVDIYSHIKNKWVYHNEHTFRDVYLLFEDLQVTKDNTLLRMKPDNLLYYSLRLKGYSIKYHGQ